MTSAADVKNYKARRKKMREYKFRGLTAKNEWVYGYLANEKRGHGWNKNDWVYAYTFEKKERQEGP